MLALNIIACYAACTRKKNLNKVKYIYIYIYIYIIQRKRLVLSGNICEVPLNNTEDLTVYITTNIINRFYLITKSVL